MRVSNRMQAKTILDNLATINNKMSTYMAQIASGKSFQRPSENPYDAIRSMDVRTKIQRIEQYESNLYSARELILELETGLDGIKDSVATVRDNITLAINGTYTPEDRQIMAQTVDNMRDNIIGILNKDFGGRYIFGGHNTSTPPLVDTGAQVLYNDVDILTMTNGEYTQFEGEDISLALGKGSDIDVSMPAVTITGHGADNLINLLDEISTVLKDSTSSGEDLSPLLGKIDDKYQNILNSITSLGSKTVRLDIVETQIDDTKYNLDKLQTEIEGVEIEKAITDYKTAEMAYNAALAAGAQIIQPTLLDFLR